MITSETSLLESDLNASFTPSGMKCGNADAHNRSLDRLQRCNKFDQHDGVCSRGRSRSPSHSLISHIGQSPQLQTPIKLPQIQATEEINTSHRHRRCFSPISGVDANDNKHQQRAGRSLSREPAGHLTRARSPSPSWMRVGWAVGRRGRSSDRTGKNDPDLAHTLDIHSANKLSPRVASPRAAAHSRRRFSAPGLPALPAVAARRPSREQGAGGFDALLQALRI